VGIYLHEMNLLARKIGLSRSHWASPHGLSNPYNLSSAEDVARLCMFAMKHPKFREVVITKHYTSTYYYQ
jgi:D-alanyl-D-alanine carboxypeptidase